MSFVKNGTSDLVGLFLDTIEIFGVHGRPSEVTCNCMATSLAYTYNPQTKVRERDIYDCVLCYTCVIRVLYVCYTCVVRKYSRTTGAS